jgi:hypothetical protein
MACVHMGDASEEPSCFSIVPSICNSDNDVESQNAQRGCDYEEDKETDMILSIVGIEIILRLLLTLLANLLKLSVVVVDCCC